MDAKAQGIEGGFYFHSQLAPQRISSRRCQRHSFRRVFDDAPKGCPENNGNAISRKIGVCGSNLGRGGRDGSPRGSQRGRGKHSRYCEKKIAASCKRRPRPSRAISPCLKGRMESSTTRSPPPRRPQKRPEPLPRRGASAKAPRPHSKFKTHNSKLPRLAPLHVHDHPRRCHPRHRALPRGRFLPIPHHSPIQEHSQRTRHKPQNRMKKKTLSKKPNKFDPLDSPQWISQSSARPAVIETVPADESVSPGPPAPNPCNPDSKAPQHAEKLNEDPAKQGTKPPNGYGGHTDYQKFPDPNWDVFCDGKNGNWVVRLTKSTWKTMS